MVLHRGNTQLKRDHPWGYYQYHQLHSHAKATLEQEKTPGWYISVDINCMWCSTRMQIINFEIFLKFQSNSQCYLVRPTRLPEFFVLPPKSLDHMHQAVDVYTRKKDKSLNLYMFSWFFVTNDWTALTVPVPFINIQE